LPKNQLLKGPLLHFCCAAKASAFSKPLSIPIKSIIQDITGLPAAPGKAALAFSLHLISC
jgi:hypothetical protein